MLENSGVEQDAGRGRHARHGRLDQWAGGYSIGAPRVSSGSVARSSVHTNVKV